MLKNLSCILVIIALSLLPNISDARSGGPPDGYTGAPNEETCVACHNSFELNSGQGSLHLEGLPNRYELGVTYELSVRLLDPDASRWGFELTVLDQDRRRAGEIEVTDENNTQISGGGDHRQAAYLKHTSAGTHRNQQDEAEWTFDWTAPDEALGEIGFYVAGNAANGNNGTSGDHIYTASEMLIVEDPPPPPDEFTFELAQGWNYLSIPMIPEPATFADIFSTLIEFNSLVIIRDQAGNVFDPLNEVYDIDTWVHENGYQIKTAMSSRMILAGTFAEPGWRYELNEGLNWISFPRQDSLFIDEAFVELGDRLEMVKDGSGRIAVPSYDYSELGYIHPGQAWMIKLSAGESVNFGWPEPDFEYDEPEARQNTSHFPTLPNTGRNMHLLVTGWENVAIHNDDELAIHWFDMESEVWKLAGASVVVDTPFAVTIWGDDDVTPETTEGPLEQFMLAYTYWSAAADSEIIQYYPLVVRDGEQETPVIYLNDDLTVLNIYHEPAPDAVAESKPNSVPGDFILTGVYPNPFNAVTEIGFMVGTTDRVQLRLWNTAGQLIWQNTPQEFSAGEHRYQLNGSGLPAGIYLVELQGQANRAVTRVVLLK